jgi:hypothetical protein
MNIKYIRLSITYNYIDLDKIVLKYNSFNYVYNSISFIKYKSLENSTYFYHYYTDILLIT